MVYTCKTKFKGGVLHMYTFTHLHSVFTHKNKNSTSCENVSKDNFQLCKNVKFRKKCQLLTVACIETLDKSATACFRQYLIAMHLSIWRHHDNTWRTLKDAARGGSTCFQRWKLYLIDKLGIMNKYFIEHLFKYNVFYNVQFIFF